jgi:hypothetical protein
MNALNTLFLMLIFTFIVEIDLYFVYVGMPILVFNLLIIVEAIFSIISVLIFRSNN